MLTRPALKAEVQSAAEPEGFYGASTRHGTTMKMEDQLVLTFYIETFPTITYFKKYYGNRKHIQILRAISQTSTMFQDQKKVKFHLWYNIKSLFELQFSMSD